jgi:NAD(P)-dependent dehydrogenase (short-subunit alcohol dehydrogenase family)
VSPVLLRDKVVVVSGIGPGLGQELAYGAAREGARVVLAARTAAFLEEVRAKLEAQGAEALAAPTDVTSREQCQRLVQAALARFGRVDALINSAYTMGRVMPFEDADLERWQVPFKVNLFGSLTLSQAVVAPMKSQGGGAIVMVGSITARKPHAKDTAYGASKAALQAAARNLALELGPYRIRVNTAMMGRMWGPNVEAQVERVAAERGVPPEQVKREFTARMALPEIPDDADCAGAVLFLASDYARAITGATLDVNGGEWMP